ncbi:MAG: N-6 DNA methylase, partial [Patescibacteria group bacterium]|nr:N-6 DNA methylase [Patescibacteria group bacterium]
MEAILTNTVQKKHFGQYFSGAAIASLLAHLAYYETASLVIDPMSGTGDMLAACEPTNNPNKNYCGVEIDNGVYTQSLYRFQPNPNVELLNGNAFQPSIIKKLTAVQYDLVITNPPYVRYQS